MLRSQKGAGSDTSYDVYAVSRYGQLFSKFRLTWRIDGVCSLFAAKCRAEEVLTDGTGNELVIIVTEGSETGLDETQRLVLTKLLPADSA